MTKLPQRSHAGANQTSKSFSIAKENVQNPVGHFGDHSLLFALFGGLVQQPQLFSPLFQAFNWLIIAFGKLQIQLPGDLDTHLFGCAHQGETNGSGWDSDELRIHTFGFCDMIQLLQRDVPHGRRTVSIIAALWQASTSKQEPGRLWRTNEEFVGAVSSWHQRGLNGHFWSHLGGSRIEVLAETHHVDPQGSQRLSQFGCCFGSGTRYNQPETPDDGHGS